MVIVGSYHFSIKDVLMACLKVIIPRVTTNTICAKHKVQVDFMWIH
jgi:hypothetical protein